MTITKILTNSMLIRLFSLLSLVFVTFSFVITPSVSSQSIDTFQVPIQAQTPPTPPSNTGGGDLPVGLDFLQILPFQCLFSTQDTGCTEDNSLLDALINFLYGLAIPFAILVIIWGGYRYFFGGLNGKTEGLKTVQAAVVGLTLVLTARLITDTINDTFSSSEGLNTDAIEALIGSITDLLINLSIAAAVLVIVWGGYKYFFGGIIEKQDGLKTIRAGTIGLVFILLARFIANTLNELFQGINEAEQAAELPGRVESFLLPILTQVTSVLQGIAGLVSVLVIVWGGYQYFFSTLPNGKKNGLETISKGVIGLVVTILALPLVTLVEQTLGASNETLEIDPGSIIFTIQTIVTNFLIPVSAAITVFFIILGAYQWLSAGGDSNKVKAGKDSLRNAVIGLVVVLLATTFTQLIIFLFRNTDLNPNGGSQTQQTTQQQNSGGNNNQNSSGNNSNNTGSGGRPTPDAN